MIRIYSCIYFLFSCLLTISPVSLSIMRAGNMFILFPQVSLGCSTLFNEYICGMDKSMLLLDLIVHLDGIHSNKFSPLFKIFINSITVVIFFFLCETTCHLLISTYQNAPLKSKFSHCGLEDYPWMRK